MLNNPASAAKAREHLEARIAADAVAWARTAFAMTVGEIAAAVGASPRTVARWAEGGMAPSSRHLDRIEHLNELRHLLGAVFPDHEAAREWLHAPSPALRGRTPMGEIRRGRVEPVIGLLAGIVSGSFD